MEALEAGALLNAEIISGTMIHHGLNPSFENLCLQTNIWEFDYFCFVYISISVFFKIKTSLGHLHLSKFHLQLKTVLFCESILRSKIQLYVLLFPFPSVIVNHLGFPPFLLMRLFNFYLNITLVSKISYLLCKTIIFLTRKALRVWVVKNPWFTYALL